MSVVDDSFKPAFKGAFLAHIIKHTSIEIIKLVWRFDNMDLHDATAAIGSMRVVGCAGVVSGMFLCHLNNRHSFDPFGLRGWVREGLKKSDIYHFGS